MYPKPAKRHRLAAEQINTFLTELNTTASCCRRQRISLRADLVLVTGAGCKALACSPALSPR
jgi:hypothetical protein